MIRLPHLAAYAATLNRCVQCGLCQSACPVYAHTRNESDGPRGHVSLLRGVLDGKISERQAQRRMASCLLCGQCENACPAGMPLSRIFRAARWDMPNERDSSWYLWHATRRLPQKFVDAVQPALSACQPALKHFAMIRKKNLPRLAGRPARATWEKTPAQPKKGRVILFAGCLARRFFPDLVHSCAQVLIGAGYEVSMPAQLGCCGRPETVAGAPGMAEGICRRNLAILAKLEFDYLVTPCPGCLHTIARVWPELGKLPTGFRQQAISLASKARDIHALLPAAANVAPAGHAGKIIWHKPCLMDAQTDASVRALLGISQKSSPAAGHCCGFARNSVVGSDLWRELLASGATAVATGCPGCMLRLRQLAQAEGLDLPIMHGVELFVRQLPK